MFGHVERKKENKIVKNIKKLNINGSYVRSNQDKENMVKIDRYKL